MIDLKCQPSVVLFEIDVGVEECTSVAGEIVITLDESRNGLKQNCNNKKQDSLTDCYNGQPT